MKMNIFSLKNGQSLIITRSVRYRVTTSALRVVTCTIYKHRSNQ